MSNTASKLIIVLFSFMALLACIFVVNARSDSKRNITEEISKEALTPSGMVDESKLLKTGELPDIVEGSPKAPVTIVEYYSLTCAHCAEFYLYDLPIIRRKYIKTGKVRLIKREFPYDPRATAAFMLARCAPRDKYDAFVDVLFNKFMSWVPAKDAMKPLENFARLSGFTHEKFIACLANEDLMKKVNSGFQRGKNEYGIMASPTFFINGEKYTGRLTAAEMSKIVDNLLKHTNK